MLRDIPRWLHIGLLTVCLAFSAGIALAQSSVPLVIVGGISNTIHLLVKYR